MVTKKAGRPTIGSAQKKRQKTIRLGPRTQFIVSTLATVDGRKQIAIIEDAIAEKGKTTYLGKKPVADYFDFEPAVAELNLLACPEYRKRDEQAEKRAFVSLHWSFFYTEEKCINPDRQKAIILWPHIERLLQLWRETKHTDQRAAAREMQDMLKQAQDGHTRKAG